MSNRVRRRETRGMKTLYVSAITLVTVAIAICLLFGTIGWVAIGFGVLTDCTNNYDCSATHCAPCATTGLWINAGGLAQLLLAGAGVGLLIRGLRTRQSGRLASGGAVLLVSSVLIVAGTTWQAQRSYCQPGSPGYRSSYCSTGD
jgi:hypothetical protein